MAPATYPLRCARYAAPQPRFQSQERDAEPLAPGTGTYADSICSDPLEGSSAPRSLGNGRTMDQQFTSLAEALTENQHPSAHFMTVTMQAPHFIPGALHFPYHRPNQFLTPAPNARGGPSSSSDYTLTGGGARDPLIQCQSPNPYPSASLFQQFDPTQAQHELMGSPTVSPDFKNDGGYYPGPEMTACLAGGDFGHYKPETRADNLLCGQDALFARYWSNDSSGSAIAPQTQSITDFFPRDRMQGSSVQMCEHVPTPANRLVDSAHPSGAYAIQTPHSDYQKTVTSSESFNRQSHSDQSTPKPCSPLISSPARQAPIDTLVSSRIPQETGRQTFGNGAIHSSRARVDIERRYRNNIEAKFENLRAVIAGSSVLVPRKLSKAIVLEKAYECICVKTEELNNLKAFLNKAAPEVLTQYERERKPDSNTIRTPLKNGAKHRGSDDIFEVRKLWSPGRTSGRLSPEPPPRKKRKGKQRETLPSSSPSL